MKLPVTREPLICRPFRFVSTITHALVLLNVRMVGKPEVMA
jgi:hypothetical protein